MSTTKHQAIRAAIAAALVVAPALASGNVFENRAYELPNGRASQIHIDVEESEPQVGSDGVIFTGAPRDWNTVVHFVIKARKDGATEASDVAMSLWADVYARVMADITLGGALGVQDLQPGQMTVDQDEADSSIARLDWRVTVIHRTSNQTLT